MLSCRHIELDAINWQSDGAILTRQDRRNFVRRAIRGIAAEAWVVDGNYGPGRDRVWKRGHPPLIGSIMNAR